MIKIHDWGAGFGYIFKVMNDLILFDLILHICNKLNKQTNILCYVYIKTDTFLECIKYGIQVIPSKWQF